MEPYRLHSSLKLGVATAATQIEGGDKNNSWYRFSSEKGNVKDNSSPLRANNHYELFKEDTALMKSMGIEIYRMGVEWSRIEPSKGQFNPEAAAHYIEEITILRQNGIETLVTLHHFSNPLWFEDIGGFEKKENIPFFLEFVEYIVKKLKGLVNEYVTINEANIYAANSFLFGNWYPKKKSMRLASNVMKNLSIAHIESYKIIKKISPDAKVGFANHMAGFVPADRKNIFDRIGAHFYDKAFNDSVNKAMAKGIFTFPMGRSRKYKGNYIDFFGINYYTQNKIKGTKMYTEPNAPHNDLGWEINSECFKNFITRFHDEYKTDIYVTENGTADKNDSFRGKFIYDHLKVISSLEYVRKYYHWTFMDNWEWAEGEEAKFGLIECNFKTQERIRRPSSYFYQEIIEKKEITEEMIEKYLQK